MEHVQYFRVFSQAAMMSPHPTILPILRTKLHRPRTAPDIMPRPHLMDQLNQHRHQPLTLISAPAGYGKSTLASNWLESLKEPSAWLSLDEHDNSLYPFLTYLLAAVQSLFPTSLSQTEALLSAPNLPPLSVLTHALIDELDAIAQPFILVLDDYHIIQNHAVNDLLTAWLRHPLKPLHLVIVTRLDPPLPLHTLRARGQMMEIRTQQLRFTLTETVAFLTQHLRLPIGDAMARQLGVDTEGWATGLRLAALSLRHSGRTDNLMTIRAARSRYVSDYLLTEVLGQQSPVRQNYLLQTAILERFCTSLVQAVCEPDTERETSELDIASFLSWLSQSNLFVVPLDDQLQWYRYHRLFRAFLQQRLEEMYDPDVVATLHRRASTWFTQNGFIDEALNHALSGYDTAMAVQIVAQHRHALMNQEQWHHLARWERAFPRETVDTTPELLLMKAWISQTQFRYLDLDELLRQAEALMANLPEESSAACHMRGEIAALRSTQYYFLNADSQRVITNATLALESTPRERHNVRGIAFIMLSGAHQLRGDLDRAFAVVDQALQEASSLPKIYHARLLSVRCFIHWMVADLQRLQQEATQLLRLSEDHQLSESLSFAQSFLGSVFYHYNDLDAVERVLIPLIESRYVANAHCFAHSAFALALTYQAQGNADKAHELALLPVEYAQETHNAFLLPLATAFQAELALRQGRLVDAIQWAEQYDPTPLRPMPRFYVPQLTLVKVLLAQDTPHRRQQAAALLSQLEGFVIAIHNTRFQIEVWALQALLDYAQGHEAAALRRLTHAIDLAKNSGFIRLFVDLGPNMMHLLGQLQPQPVTTPYVAQILSAFSPDRGGAAAPATEPSPDHPAAALMPRPSTLISDALLAPLTNRELEVLELLAKRLSNQEIADQLYLATETVRKHTSNIYRKLDVHNRLQAVDKAYALHLLPLRSPR